MCIRDRTIIHPLLASSSAPNYRQSWRLAGVWRRAINLMTESGELLTLHRQGSGFGPGGWMLRRAQFDALCGCLLYTSVCFIHWFINPDWRLHAAFVYLWQRYLPAGGAGSGTHTTVLQYPFTRE